MKKKFLMLLLACCMIAPCAFAFSGCGKKTPPANVHALNVKNAYAMGAVAGATYLNGQTAVRTIGANTLPQAVDGELDKFNEYMKMFEGYLLTGKTNVTTAQATEADFATYEGYQVTANSIKQEITVPMLDSTSGEKFTMFYTEEQSGNKFVRANDDDKNEVHAELTGVVLVGSNVYTLWGHRETETEQNEYECEIEFYIKKNNNHFIKMEYSNEVELNETEDEFEISIYTNNSIKPVSSTQVSFEKENGEIKMELEFNDGVPTANHTKYTVKHQVVDTTDAYVVSYVASGVRGSFNVKVASDPSFYDYTFADGTLIKQLAR